VVKHLEITPFSNRSVFQEPVAPNLELFSKLEIIGDSSQPNYSH
jgi:hypothetical protein